MIAILSSKAKAYFQPFFVTHINGAQKQLSLDEVTNNWHKYVHTAVGKTLYSNWKELKSYLNKTKPTTQAIKLDMSKANRGSSFGRKTAIEDFKVKQERARKKLLAQQEKFKKQLTAHKSALTKAANKASKEAAKELSVEQAEKDQKDADTSNKAAKK